MSKYQVTETKVNASSRLPFEQDVPPARIKMDKVLPCPQCHKELRLSHIKITTQASQSYVIGSRARQAIPMGVLIELEFECSKCGIEVDGSAEKYEVNDKDEIVITGIKRVPTARIYSGKFRIEKNEFRINPSRRDS